MGKKSKGKKSKAGSGVAVCSHITHPPCTKIDIDQCKAFDAAIVSVHCGGTMAGCKNLCSNTGFETEEMKARVDPIMRKLCEFVRGHHNDHDGFKLANTLHADAAEACLKMTKTKDSCAAASHRLEAFTLATMAATLMGHCCFETFGDDSFPTYFQVRKDHRSIPKLVELSDRELLKLVHQDVPCNCLMAALCEARKHSPSVRVCRGCLVVHKTSDCRKCGRCEERHCCSKECQVLDWKRCHSKECKNVSIAEAARKKEFRERFEKVPSSKASDSEVDSDEKIKTQPVMFQRR